jgi:hypothetical protein
MYNPGKVGGQKLSHYREPMERNYLNINNECLMTPPTEIQLVELYFEV